MQIETNGGRGRKLRRRPVACYSRMRIMRIRNERKQKREREQRRAKGGETIGIKWKFASKEEREKVNYNNCQKVKRIMLGFFFCLFYFFVFILFIPRRLKAALL